MTNQEKNQFNLSIDSMLELLKSNKKSKSIVTIKSKETGKDFTYKIVRKEFNGRLWTHVYVEVQYLQFKYLGWFDGKNLVKKKIIQNSQSALAISWCLRNLYLKPEVVEKQTVWYHTGSCIKCGRTLTDANSIQKGIGPLCRMKV